MAELGILNTLRSGISDPAVLVSMPAVSTVGALPVPAARVVPKWSVSPDDYLTLLLSAPTNGVITGTLSVAGVPSGERYVVRCYHKESGSFVAQALTDAAGNYAFFDLDPAALYTIIAHDKAGAYNAVVRDNVTPDLNAGLLEGSAASEAAASGTLTVTP